MTDKVRQENAIEWMDKFILVARVHGINVVMFKDVDISMAKSHILKNCHWNRVHASRMFQPSIWSRQNRVWKNMLCSEDNQTLYGAAHLARVWMWMTFEDMQPYLS